MLALLLLQALIHVAALIERQAAKVREFDLGKFN
jgi:hypothetical protein